MDRDAINTLFKFWEEDKVAILDKVNTELRTSMFYRRSVFPHLDRGDVLVFTAEIEDKDTDFSTEIDIRYMCDKSGNIFVGETADEIAEGIIAEYGYDREITSSHKYVKSAAVDETFPEFEDSHSIDDRLEGISDKVESLQDDIDEVEEDDIDIEVENNISNHYIAECGACQGTFISALNESDQDVEAIKGVCPLCEKESEQSLKWIIREV